MDEARSQVGYEFYDTYRLRKCADESRLTQVQRPCKISSQPNCKPVWKNQHRLTRKEQRLEQLEQTKHLTQTREEQDAERSTRAEATEFPPDTSAETIKKFIMEVMQTDAFKVQYTTNQLYHRPDNPCLVDVQQENRKRNNFAKTLRRSQHAVERTSRGRKDVSKSNSDMRETKY